MEQSRYERVSRRAVLRAAGVSAAAILTGCGNEDVQIFAGARTESVAGAPIPTTSALPVPDQAVASAEAPTVEPSPPPTVEPTPTAEPQAEAQAESAQEPVVEPTVESAQEPAVEPTDESAQELAPTPAPSDALAVAGEMAVAFTYTQGVGGKNERPYIAVWIENPAGELLQTVALWYEQGRRGARWLDHLTQWWDRDQARILNGGTDESVTISSATRAAGSYTVVWDGNINGVPAPAGHYSLFIESAREEGPVSLIAQPLTLTGALPQTALPSDGELSQGFVWINV